MSPIASISADFSDICPLIFTIDIPRGNPPKEVSCRSQPRTRPFGSAHPLPISRRQKLIERPGFLAPKSPVLERCVHGPRNHSTYSLTRPDKQSHEMHPTAPIHRHRHRQSHKSSREQRETRDKPHHRSARSAPPIHNTRRDNCRERRRNRPPPKGDEDRKSDRSRERHVTSHVGR